MAINLEQIETDAQIANDRASAVLIAVTQFMSGRVAGQSYTAGQKTALRAQFDADVRAAKAAIDAIVAELDAG